jgi:hypothetical protein
MCYSAWGGRKEESERIVAVGSAGGQVADLEPMRDEYYLIMVGI